MPSAATDLGKVKWPANLSPVHFIKLELTDSTGKMISDNFYWHSIATNANNLTDLSKLPVVTLTAITSSQIVNGKCFVKVKLSNPGNHIALMAHLQLRTQESGQRVLPVYYSDNYVSLTVSESKDITIEASLADLKGGKPMITIDGWNILVKSTSANSVAVKLNEEAQVAYWPVTNLPLIK